MAKRQALRRRALSGGLAGSCIGSTLRAATIRERVVNHGWRQTNRSLRLAALNLRVQSILQCRE
jgi:hypothetical protein